VKEMKCEEAWLKEVSTQDEECTNDQVVWKMDVCDCGEVLVAMILVGRVGMVSTRSLVK